MNVALNDEELDQYLKDAMVVSKDYPVVISRYILDAQVCYLSVLILYYLCLFCKQQQLYILEIYKCAFYPLFFYVQGIIV